MNLCVAEKKGGGARMPTAKPISDLQRNMAAITHECQKTKCPIYLTKNGTATLVIMDADAFGEEMSAHHAVHDHKRAYSRYHAQP